MDFPRPFTVVRAVGGFALAGVGATLTTPASMGEALELALVPFGGALVLTLPALLVVHQYMKLSAPPVALFHALVRSLVGTGQIALALVPVTLFFSLSSSLGADMFVLLWAGLGLFNGALSVLNLQAAEEASTLQGRASMFTLTMGWVVLAGLVALRLAADPIFNL